MRGDWTAEELLRILSGRSLHTQDWSASGVSIDSRTAMKDDLFIAIQGPEQDGHAYVCKAFEKGAAAAIVSRQPPQAAPDKPLIFVEDTFKALQDLGAAGRARAKGKILAVTGSVGKTSTKEMLRLMLGMVGDTYANEGSLNNHWGVPLSLARLPQDARYGVFEIGMNHAGELGPLSRVVAPHVALITNVEAVHLAHFESTDSIADAKAEIFEGMAPHGIAVLNHDNPHYGRLHAAAKAKGVKEILSFGCDGRADARLLNIVAEEDGTRVEALIKGIRIHFRIGTPGTHLALNALGAMLACYAAGAELTLCAEALDHYRPPSGRGTRQSLPFGEGELTLIDESFNASPVAVKAAIGVLGQTPVPEGARKIAVLGDMRELGDAAAGLHLSLLESLVENGIDTVHCCGELMTHLYDALPGGMRGHLSMDSATLAPQIAAEIRSGDAVMVKGSHSMHMEKIVQAIQSLSKEKQKAKA